jgi:hypothetical protein
MFRFIDWWFSPKPDSSPDAGAPLGKGSGERDGVTPVHDDRTDEPMINPASALRRGPPRAV